MLIGLCWASQEGEALGPGGQGLTAQPGTTLLGAVCWHSPGIGGYQGGFPLLEKWQPPLHNTGGDHLYERPLCSAQQGKHQQHGMDLYSVVWLWCEQWKTSTAKRPRPSPPTWKSRHRCCPSALSWLDTQTVVPKPGQGVQGVSFFTSISYVLIRNLAKSRPRFLFRAE